MNCIPRLTITVAALWLCAGCNAPASAAGESAEALVYGLDYTLRLAPDDGVVHVTAEVSQRQALLREMTFPAFARIDEIEGDGEIERSGTDWHWRPPASGGSLRWQVRVDHRRNGDGYDARLGSDWGLFRAEDVIPRAASRTLRGATSRTTMRISAPRGWSVVTQYFERDNLIVIDNPQRRFDQPGGWIVAGELGVRRETISGVRVAVAGPVNQSIRRMDVLALLHWTLPSLSRILPELPERITVVSAGDPMWRGGLSGPQSIFLHADRPLISENATSTLLHEVLHMSLGINARKGYDWIVEGLAEYYSLELLHRSGTISTARFRQATSDLETWSHDADMLCQAVSSGPATAKAVVLFSKLNREMRKKSAGTAGLDDLARVLVTLDSPVDLRILAATADDVAGATLETLDVEKLPGCSTIAAVTAER